ncbi:hypothetical protein R5R35_013406 [Gryllus longicercus]|uniref:Cuticular protein n=1 Tax=Gryllus longicercus TaxID=2509291 RepID=A0AAN9VYL5_9ORTH
MQNFQNLVVLALLGCALAEPPVNRGYLPPQARFSAPSQQYGAPASGPARIFAPSSQYGAPASGPARISAPSRQYGAPASGSARISAPSRQFGAPARSSAPSTQYGAPARIAAPAPARFYAPSEQYGAPAAAVISARAPARLSAAPAPVYGAPTGPYADARARLQEDDLAEPANYEYQYAVEDYESGANFGHREDRQDESAQGEYRVLLPDGRTQIVEYEADQEGYRPVIRYEEAEGPYPASASASQRRQQQQSGPY